MSEPWTTARTRPPDDGAVAPSSRRPADHWPAPHPYPGTRRQVAVRLGLGAVAVTLLLLLVGLALTHLPEAGRLVRDDLAVDRWLEAHRTGLLDTLTVFGSGSANTQTAIAVTVVAGLLLRWWLGRWYESWVVVAAIVGELLIFLVVTAVVHRPRPTVHLMDVAPPTSSFPSGHVGAAVALYGCLATIVLRYARHRGWAVLVATLLWLLPFVVGASRLYRGMHFPSDVLAGALGGGLWLLVVLTTLLPRADRGTPAPARR